MNKMDTSTASEVVFLRQIVQRLNNLLSKYTNPEKQNLLDPSTADYPTSPWLTDVTILSPILQEYDKHLTELVSEIERLKNDNALTKSKFQAMDSVFQGLIEENEKLQHDIQKNLENQINDTDGNDLDHGTGNRDELLLNLQEQLELTNNEKEESVSMCREVMFQLDKMRHQQQSESLEIATKLRSFDEICARNEQLQEATLSLQLALGNTREENKALATALREQESAMVANQNEVKDMRLKFQQLKLKHEERETETNIVLSQLDEANRELHDIKRSANFGQTTIENYRQELTEAESKLAQAMQTASNAEMKINSLKIEISALEKSNKELEEKDVIAMTKLRENGQLVENACLTRDAAIARERITQEECNKMKEAMESLVDEVASRINKEVDKVRKQHASAMQGIVGEMQTMELEQSNLQSEIDRLRREKRSVEEECERISKQQIDEFSNNKLHDTHARMLIAERARDDSLLNLQALEDKHKRVKIEHENDRLSWMSKNDALTRSIEQLKRQMDENCHERMLLLESVNKHKNDLQKKDEETHNTQIQASKEMAKVKSEVGIKNKQLKAKIRMLEEVNNNEMNKLHHLLSDQQRMTARWKEESQRCSEKYESKIQQYKTELSRSKRRITELSNRLQQANMNSSVKTSAMPELEETNRTLRARLHETEYKLLSATEKLGQMHEIKTSLSVHDLN